ncbi:hypothetical protein LSH36_351g02026 [Paralvinella palmiformis]|uniref:Uncharacterized protein n=1 Tax=Paralvinella palmiformis TaxID=53620 RepID=A0AAD9JEM6_9ANNE|nr:hypothetical protein LSH36_351g02026 [Paralvinella palmiformis]
MAQRRFLIRQVFEKGLVPSVGQQSPDRYSDLDGEAVSPLTGDRDYYISVSPCASPQPEPELARSVTLPDIRPKSTDFRSGYSLEGTNRKSSADNRRSSVDLIQMLPPIAGAGPDAGNLSRSHSLEDLDMRRFHRSVFPSYRFQPLQLATLAETDRENDPSAPSATQDFRSEFSPARSRRHDFAELKRNPENLFPKMRFLIEHGPEALDSGERDDVKSANDDNDVKRQMNGGSSGDSTKDNYLKLIQKITTYLPDHLMESAKHQIREMTKSEAIYRQKEKLLSHEREKISIEDNPKWRQLRITLSPGRPILHLGYK